ncbi:helix-turn-helix domain-containing protein [Providencia huashanensis]|uniref:helix-turn-helix domain-containing protein n=1 Tax=Providencia huashanensis TaxID=3037798 RepID=UPI002AFDD1DC|nr:helix-turn-helix transcriptional regulator [Providencia sp. 23021821]
MKSEKNISVLAGRLLKEYRTSAGYTVWKLAEKINRSEQQLFRYERGVNKIDLDTLLTALRVLNIPSPDFFAQLEDMLAREISEDNESVLIKVQTPSNIKAAPEAQLLAFYE